MPQKYVAGASKTHYVCPKTCYGYLKKRFKIRKKNCKEAKKKSKKLSSRLYLGGSLRASPPRDGEGKLAHI